ncbi:MAG: HEAT repeat domain-containing protein [Elusimicrobia bacterium]|nr:HEAT repeat domain-containing protein [Elusimicrobiota bacterium]
MPAFILAFLSLVTVCQAELTYKGFDIYRSRTATVEKIQKAVGPWIDSYMRMRQDGRPPVLRNADRLKDRIEREVRRLGRLAFVNMHYAEYITSADRGGYITFELVDVQDAALRMPFKPAPAKSLADPQGLLAAWRQYYDIGISLSAQGALPTERVSCPAFFCLWGSATPELGALEKQIRDGVAANKKFLHRVAVEDRDPQKRAAALYVLSYSTSGAEVVDLMMDRLQDPSEEVRAAALQVLSDIALYSRSLFIEVKKIIPLLDYPTSSDRSKAMGVLIGLADNPTYRPYVLSRATPYLLGLLKLEQPSNHDLAFTLLSILSKERYGRRDYQAWEKWISSQTSPIK